MSDQHRLDAPDPDEKRGQRHTAGAFDIRNFIGALLGLYGLILLVMGIFGDQALQKTGGVNANLWAGIVLLAHERLLLRLGADQADHRARARRARRRRPGASRSEASPERELTTRRHRRPDLTRVAARPPSLTVRTGCGVSGEADRRGTRRTSGS